MGRRNAKRVSPAEVRAALERGAREWPDWLTSSSSDSPFVHQPTDVWVDAPQCKGVRPMETWNGMRPPPVILRKSWTPEEVNMGWRGTIPMRAVVWAARAGMGNSIRGLIHTFLFALLSSRQLLISTAGPWGTSIQALFEEFNGTLDRLDGNWVPRVPMYSYYQPDFQDKRPLVQGMPNLNRDDWWYKDEGTRSCALGALNCADIWCVRSRIVQMMLGQPKNQLGEAIQGSLVVSQMLTPQELHQRHHHSVRILNDFLPWRKPGGISLRQRGKPKMGNPNMEGEEVHPALKLKFDVALHIRTVHTCVEKGSEGRKGCKSRGLGDAYQALQIFPELQQYMSVHKWACVSGLLSFMLQLKAKHTQRLKQGEHFNLGQVPKYGDRLWEFLEGSSQSPGERPKATSKLQSEAWTLEDAKAVAAEAMGVIANQNLGTPLSNPAQGLSIFVATDSEALRPLFVEFLRPFGTVAYSSAGVVHLSFSKGEARVQSKSGTLSEFYLLSRSANIVAFDKRNSTYGEMAALYGNNTLIRGTGPKVCNFLPEHVGVPIAQ